MARQEVGKVQEMLIVSSQHQEATEEAESLKENGQKQVVVGLNCLKNINITTKQPKG